MVDHLKLSIVVPVYNGGNILKDSLKDYANQLTKDMELLLIDDGSTDGSAEVCLQCQREAGEQGRLVRYVRQENQGIAGARNRGIREAEGKFICFFDQDDRADLTVYEGLFKKMDQAVVHMGMCSTGFGTDSGWLPYESLDDAIFEGGQVKNLVSHLFLNGFNAGQEELGLFFYGTIWKCVFEREWILRQKLLFHFFKNYEDDLLFVLESLLKVENVLCVKEMGYYWRENPVSESHDRNYLRDLIDREEKLEEYVAGLLRPAGLADACMGPFLCGEVLGLLDNVHFARRGRERREEKQRVKAWIQRHKAEGSFRCEEMIKKNVIRKRYTCGTLQKHSFGMAYFIDRCVCLLISVVSLAKIVRKMERRGKHKG